jgi:transposase-like protein/IS1 family transposase
MVVNTCNHESKKKHGKDRKGNQRYRCLVCGATWTERGPKPIGEMRVKVKDACKALEMLLEGMSIRSCQRITGLDRNTLCDLVLTVGQNCQRLLDATIQDVPVTDVQIDELWGFIRLKEKNRIARGYSEEFGDSWTFLAIERNNKLILAHQVGQRDETTCWALLQQLKVATSGRFQVSTDGLATYTNNVPLALGNRVDFAQLIKNYASSQSETRYSPATIISAEKKPRFGNPDASRICTSHVERANLTVRMGVRRFTRLTNAHSKSPKHHAAMMAMFVAWYNFCRKHETIKSTPAMAAGVMDKAWSIKELLTNAAEA